MPAPSVPTAFGAFGCLGEDSQLDAALEIAREVADALIPVAGSAPTPGIEREDISGHHLVPPVTALTESARRPVGYSPRDSARSWKPV